MSSFTPSRAEMEKALRDALRHGQIEVHYQPQVDLARNGTICALEALVRWNHPSRGTLLPQDFIPLATEMDLIGLIDDFVLLEACRQARRWVENFDPNLRIAVNLSARQFVHELPRRLAGVLREACLPARNLELELTESLVMKDVSLSIDLLRQLKTLGIELAIDDFGTGYSSLAYLKRFPIDQIKIDRSFVGDIANKPEDAAICSSIIALAHSLQLRVVAEGVEQDSQLGFLLQHQCDRMQGYIFEPPLPAERIDELLRSGRRLDLSRLNVGTPQRTLLLVDDEEHIIAALRRVLRRAGYNIVSTTDPRKAFELLAQHRVGVIVSDQRMPHMSGTEFLREVKNLYPDTMRIMLSGYTDLKSVTDAINEGAICRFLTKPWEDENLTKAIREAFEQRELVEDNRRLYRENDETNARLREANEMLTALLAEKASRIARDETMIGVAQEAFRLIPLPTLGIDDAGMIVLASWTASETIPGALPGNLLEECVPGQWVVALRDEATPLPAHVEIDGNSYRPVRERLSVPGAGAGWLLTLLPAGASCGQTTHVVAASGEGNAA